MGECSEECIGPPAPVATTGQTECYNAILDPIPCDGTGQDGEHPYGVSVDPRFTNNNDGTITDNLTGLIWLQNASCFTARGWHDVLPNVMAL